MSENQSAAVVNSTASKTPEKKAQLAAYMREYRKRRKRATEAAQSMGRDISRPADGLGETLHTFSVPEEESSPVGPSIEVGSA